MIIMYELQLEQFVVAAKSTMDLMEKKVQTWILKIWRAVASLIL